MDSSSPENQSDARPIAYSYSALGVLIVIYVVTFFAVVITGTSGGLGLDAFSFASVPRGLQIWSIILVIILLLSFIVGLFRWILGSGFWEGFFIGVLLQELIHIIFRLILYLIDELFS